MYPYVSIATVSDFKVKNLAGRIVCLDMGEKVQIHLHLIGGN